MVPYLQEVDAIKNKQQQKKSVYNIKNIIYDNGAYWVLWRGTWQETAVKSENYRMFNMAAREGYSQRERQKQIMKWYATYINNPAIINFLSPFTNFCFWFALSLVNRLNHVCCKSKITFKDFPRTKSKTPEGSNFRTQYCYAKCFGQELKPISLSLLQTRMC